MSVLHCGYDVDTEHVADVLESLAEDVRNNKAYITYASDGYDVPVDDPTTYTMELDFEFARESSFPHHFIESETAEDSAE